MSNHTTTTSLVSRTESMTARTQSMALKTPRENNRWRPLTFEQARAVSALRNK